MGTNTKRSIVLWAAIGAEIVLILTGTEPILDARKATNREVLADIEAVLKATTPESVDIAALAKALATAIIRGQVCHVSVTY